MAPQAWTTNTRNLTPDPAGYQVDDLIIDLAPRRVRRAGTVIPLKALSFDLLVTLGRAAPNLVSFEQLSEHVWPGLVVTPETIVQRVKLLRSALGDDANAPRYIEGVRGRGYRMLAEVRPLTESQGTPEFIGPPSLKETKEEESPNVHAGIAATGAAAVSTPSAAPPIPRTAASALGPRGWIGGTLTIVVLLAASWAVIHYRGVSKPAELTSAGVPPAIHSLVVLPLENLSGDKEQEYFADGMTDALITNLAQIGSLRVISRTSAMQFKGSKETLPQIGRDLRVDAVVEGTVTRGENRVRVTAQLVEASSDHHLWARTYERDLKNVLALQDEIAQDVTEQIRVKLTPKERSLLMQVHAVDPEAYDASLRGWYWFIQQTREGVWKALDYFQKAIAKDPKYALADAGVAHSLLFLGFSDELPRKETLLKAREAAVKALVLDPSLAEAHSALAEVKLYNDWDWSGAEADYKQATALNPNYTSAHVGYSNYLVAMGRPDEALKEIERARDLDPFSVEVAFWLGQVLYHARRYDDALRQDRQGLEMHPEYGKFYWAMAEVYEQKKMFAEAFAARQQALSLKNDPSVSALGEAYKRSGYRGYLLKLAQIPELPHKLAYVAHIYALLNDEPRAMTALEACYDERNEGILFMRTAPELDSIRSSPRFRDLARRIGFPQPSSDRN
jgi:TolB-like protein/DNA-binding winged helix-turn-helix (wHTH) protein/Flp pilus assembly protein TadD